MGMRVARCSRRVARSPVAARRAGSWPSWRTYHTPSTSAEPPYPEVEDAILRAAIERVPQLGFTNDALQRGATDAGYLPASTNLFSRGPFELVRYHLSTQRLALKNTVQFPAADSFVQDNPQDQIKTADKIRTLVFTRLTANSPVIRQLPGAFALMAFPSNVPASIAELSKLVDEIWYLAGDVSVDSSWYTKRASLASVYATTEVFMTQDKSPDFKETAEFLDRRLDDVGRTGKALSDVSQWLGYTGISTVNVLRSWGVRL